jgi:hypothetical protein
LKYLRNISPLSQGQRVNQAGNQKKQAVSRRRRGFVIPKSRIVSKLIGVATLKRVLFIVTAVGTYKPKCTISSSYIVVSHFASMVESVRIVEILEIHFPILPRKRRIDVGIEPPRRYTALPQSLKSSVVPLPPYCKQTVTVIVPLPSAYCIIGSDSHILRCFL